MTSDLIETARNLGQTFALRSAEMDETDGFALENAAALKASPLLAAGVPRELGGGGADGAELGAMLTELGRHCGSTALWFSMHTHQVAAAAWRLRHVAAPTGPLLTRVAQDRVLLMSSGGSDWLQGSGRAERVEGGYRIHGRKVFASGAPAGDLLLTCAVDADAEGGPQVLHFAVPMKADGVRIEPCWQAMGMRGTGSHDVVLDGFFLADGAVSGRRPSGPWHPLFHIISMVAFPLVYSAYLGVALAARDKALSMLAGRQPDPHLIAAVGEMETELSLATMAVERMQHLSVTAKPGPATTNAIFQARTLAARGMIASVTKAMDAVGGAGFRRAAGLERLFRDIQGTRFHPLTTRPQAEMSGRLALGLSIDA
ncbi:acyl-CoA dehydrogenase family protein [Niveispirillum sp. KHB5.9]|uniref:acyl-CoA dehydrogenase family protein n=1 Tax=Niveispirillum sp. KHB5.9 TaxID=3400269 RepID=UPI003A8499FA